MTMSCASCTSGIVFCNDFVECSGEVDKEIFVEVSCAASKVRVIFLGKVSDFVEESEKLWPNASKGLYDAGDDAFALSGWVTCLLVFFARTRRKASSGKGSRSAP